MVFALDVYRDDLVNLVYSMVYGKRKLKFLEDRVAVLLPNTYYSDCEGSRQLDRASALSEVCEKLGCEEQNVIFVADL